MTAKSTLGIDGRKMCAGVGSGDYGGWSSEQLRHAEVKPGALGAPCAG